MTEASARLAAEPTARSDDAPAQRRRVVVIGGGIAGLAAAWHLTRGAPQLDVIVLDAGAEVGGKLRVAELAGTRVDVGAEALLVRRPEGIALLEAVGLADQRIAPATISALIRARGANHPIPRRTLFGIPGDLDLLRASDVLSEAGLAAVAAEQQLPPMPPLEHDVSVGELVGARIGAEVTARLVEPLLGGVYAGDPDRLSLAATVPALYRRLADHGGWLVQEAAAAAGSGEAAPQPHEVFTSLRGGLGRLPAVLAGQLADVRTGTTVRELVRRPEGYQLVLGSGAAPEILDADAVVVATPAAKAARLLRGLAPAAASELDSIDTASMAIVSLAYRDVRPPAGSGLLVGSGQGFAVKAITLSSQKWPGSPDGLTLLRASIGRVGDVADLQRDDEDLVRLVVREVGALLGLDAKPIDHLVTRWGGGLPQYGVGHLQRVARIRRAVAEVPGLAVCGASYDGIGIPACVASATLAADQVLAQLDRWGQ